MKHTISLVCMGGGSMAFIKCLEPFSGAGDGTNLLRRGCIVLFVANKNNNNMCSKFKFILSIQFSTSHSMMM